MGQVLLVEDSIMFGRLAKKRIEDAFDDQVYWTKNLAETINILDMAKDNFSIAILDINLPDAPDGEVIDEVINRGISSLVFTGIISDEVREKVWGKNVADYVLKDDPSSLEYIITAMRRLRENKNTLVLVVDDSTELRTKVSELLYVHKFRVISATSGTMALDILEQHPEISLVISGFALPGMDGCELCKKVREKRKTDNLAFIGLSSETEKNLEAKFIKSGANDVITREPFLVEEFYCRVNNCLENLNLIKTIKDSAMKDFLTGLYNRRYFFDVGRSLYLDSQKNELPIACAMVDIDFFKKINDTYGHDVGDEVIKEISNHIVRNVREQDLVARFGGEEFCILMPRADKDESWVMMEMMRKKIEETAVAKNGEGDDVFVTVSIGICPTIQSDLESMIKVSDENLYRAKEGGRNRTLA